jgi:hypothetical protein
MRKIDVMPRLWMNSRRGLVAAAVAGGLLLAAAPALAAARPARAGATSAPPASYEALSASWPSPKSGLVLFGKGYDLGGTPYLFQTANGGRTWSRLAMPAAMADGSVYKGVGDILAANWNDTRFAVTRDQGRHWSAVHMAGVPAGTSFWAYDITFADGRVYALVQLHPKSGPNTLKVYSAAASANTLAPMRGLSMTAAGLLPYGDVTARGTTVQVVLGDMTTTERYWYSRDGVKFRTAPRPCPVDRLASPVETFGGAVAALCADAPSNVNPGVTDMRVWETGHLGGTFHPTGPTFISGNPQNFAAVSATKMTLVNQFQLVGTSDAAKTWTVHKTEPNGGYWPYLAFPSATTGFALADTINNVGHKEGILFRTTDGGLTWKAVSLP